MNVMLPLSTVRKRTKSTRPDEPESDLWQTPAHVIALARAVLGDIDLDPASSEDANKTVGASCIYTREDDGLAHNWYQRVWCNPPFSGGQTGKWLAHLLAQYQAGNVTAAIFLANASTDTRWFRLLWPLPLCFTYGRLRFTNPAKTASSPKYGQVLAYVGPEPERFATVFSDLGHIVLPAASTERCVFAVPPTPDPPSYTWRYAGACYELLDPQGDQCGTAYPLHRRGFAWEVWDRYRRMCAHGRDSDLAEVQALALDIATVAKLRGRA